MHSGKSSYEKKSQNFGIKYKSGVQGQLWHKDILHHALQTMLQLKIHKKGWKWAQFNLLFIITTSYLSVAIYRLRQMPFLTANP
jgi:hypothetical protein